MYKPYNSRGEDFLANYLGMLGLPLDLVSEFPETADVVVLAESAAYDKHLLAKIKRLLLAGGRVVITTGLLRKLQDNGLSDIVELRLTDRKMVVSKFQMGWDNTAYPAEEPFIVPVTEYYTNDSWEVISCNCDAAGTPLLHSANYADSKLFILTIPDNPADLYKLPAPVLGKIAASIAGDMPVYMEAPSRVSLFLYDNDTVVIHSFRDEPAGIKLVVDQRYCELIDLNPQQAPKSEFFTWLEPGKEEVRTPEQTLRPEKNSLGELSGKNVLELIVQPHSFKIIRFLPCKK
jgi:hypothetical protein